MKNILIVEDNKIQRDNLRKIITRILPDIRLLSCDNKDQALNFALKESIDLFFIDIKLNNSNGIELAKDLRKIDKYKFTWVVFITTHPDYMLNAFKQVHCYDYILKPYNKETIEKILITLQNSKIQFRKEKEYVVFKKKDMITKICVDDIMYVEVNFRTCTIHAKTGVYLISRISLKSIIDKINKDYIIKVHRSYAVNVNHIDQITKCYRGCWEVSFKNYESKALMTELYKDLLLKKMA